LDILLLDALVPEAMAWLETHHRVHFRPELVGDLPALKEAGRHTAGIVFPRHTVVTSALLDCLPKLKALGRLHVGTDNLDMEACQARGIKVIHSNSTNVRSNAEFLLTALLLLYRRGVVSALLGNRYPTTRLGRELSGSTVGILGLAPAAHALAGLLTALGVRLIGYDPAVHHSAPVWRELGIQPVALPDLLGMADAVSVQILYASRFKGFVGARLLSYCRPGQIWVSISRSDLFDPAALADALSDGRLDACVIDGVEDGFLGKASPLHGIKNLTVTPRLGSHTHEARLRSSWYVAHRMHDTLAPASSNWTPLASDAFDADSGPAASADAGPNEEPDPLTGSASGTEPDWTPYVPSGPLSALGHLV
jgi:phosphoglycerate dehydrogenase-like enzyme